ncbi:50S ribosomal protein L29 [Sphingobacterium chuzhouense]|uniref:Large ribosomal subunit protein uL29 n=1 Tax=Sphingobacterium chuzhouense TaxID=1742264 RepID=A0ABR7XWE4_9SPHI|nr:50S ribosomal protein L29 [Sphingobacterium chuzhouense]MBD1423329.1 50S ribosomal protein L29 [Sphingobacterium chuzhouense]
MKNSEIIELSQEELTARLEQEKTALNKLKFAHAVSAIENPNAIKAARKTIARISTEISKRRIAAKSETAAEA